MATYVRKLKDRSGNYIVPATRSTGVYLSDNQTLQQWIDNINTQWTQIDSRLDALEENVSSSISLLDCYPIGAIYQSWENTSPASLFGGSWVQIQNQFLYASGNKALGFYGGEEFHTLSVAELPSHTHISKYRTVIWDQPGLNEIYPITINNKPTINDFWMLSYGGEVVEYTGSNWGHNNMPPYLVVNMWRRTA